MERNLFNNGNVFYLTDDEKLELLIKKERLIKNNNREGLDGLVNTMLRKTIGGKKYTAIGFESLGSGGSYPLADAKATASQLKKAYPQYDFIIQETIGNWGEKDITKRTFVVMSNRRFSANELACIKPFVKYANGTTIKGGLPSLTHEDFVKLAKEKGYKNLDEASSSLGYRYNGEKWVDKRNEPYKKPKYANGGGVGTVEKFEYTIGGL